MKNIVFLNSLREVNEYLKAEEMGAVPDRSESLFISIDLDARSYLMREGFSVDSTLAYFNNDSHKKSLLKSKEIAEWLRENSHFDGLGIGVKYSQREWFILWGRFLSHYCLYAIEVILNIIDKHKPETFYAYVNGRRDILSTYIEPEERYFSYIAQLAARKEGLQFKELTGGIDGKPGGFYQSLNIVKICVKFAKHKLWKLKILFKNMLAGGIPIFFTDIFYQMGRFITELKKELPDRAVYLFREPVTACFRIPDFILKIFWRKYSDRLIFQRRALQELGNKIWKEGNIFSYREISFSEIICGKIKGSISNYMTGLGVWSINIDKFIDRANMSAFISSGDRFDDLTIAELCRKKGIPAVLISHGSFVPIKNEYERIEWSEQGRMLLNAPFSFIALQSPLSEAYLREIPSESRAIKTGPLILGREVNTQKSRLLFEEVVKGGYDFGKVKVIVHAGTPMPLSSLRLYVYETPDEYIQNICDLANAVEGMEDTILIVKFRPSKEISIENLKKLVPFSDKVILSVGESFVDILGMADMIASFSSTTIEETLQNRIPVLLYGCEGRYQHIPAYGIKEGCDIESSAVYHLKETGLLRYALTEIMRMDIKNCCREVFDPYIYNQNVRESLIDLLR